MTNRVKKSSSKKAEKHIKQKKPFFKETENQKILLRQDFFYGEKEKPQMSITAGMTAVIMKNKYVEKEMFLSAFFPSGQGIRLLRSTLPGGKRKL